MRRNRRSAAIQFRLAGILTLTAVLAFLFAALGAILRKGGAAENQYVIYFIIMMMAPLVILLIFGAVVRWRGRDLWSLEWQTKAGRPAGGRKRREYLSSLHEAIQSSLN